MAKVIIHVDLDSKHIATQVAQIEQMLKNADGKINVSANTRDAKRELNVLISAVSELQTQMASVFAEKGSAQKWSQYSVEQVNKLNDQVQKLSKSVDALKSAASSGGVEQLASNFKQITSGAESASTAIQNVTRSYAELFNTIQQGKAFTQSQLMSGMGAFLSGSGIGQQSGSSALPNGNSWRISSPASRVMLPEGRGSSSQQGYTYSNGSSQPTNGEIIYMIDDGNGTFVVGGGSTGGGGTGGGGIGNILGGGGIPKNNKKKGMFEEVLGTSLGNYVKRLAMYQAVSGAIYGTVQAFNEALDTMKEVDSELASIQKVTDFDADQMKKIEESAYDVASQYGVSAQDYLESVSAFAKAGYKDLADDLGELAIKTQLVGDVTASTANQFLLSVDAAWKMGGSVEDLSRVLDEANVVENNYATSIDKLAQGMPNVASVASMAGMSAEQTIAALGTITAVTQQSGTKAATALRALILNIMKDTTTEVEEGVTVTKEQISSLDEVLQVYAKDALQAAEETGKIVNPMEVVAALAKAYQENRISDRDLAKIEMALGGKLRTNQLDALLKNFTSTYQGMMGLIEDAAGSAEKEIDVMLNTWEAKANILKNTWTKFIADTLDTGLFKGILDSATAALKGIGNLQNALVNLAGALAIIKAQKIADFFNLGENAAGTIGAVAAVGTLLYNAYTVYRRRVDENAKESMETAQASASESKNLVELVSAYEKAAEGSLAQQEASAKLAAALGVEGDAVNTLADSYKELANARIESSSMDAAEARANAGKALKTQAFWSANGVRYNDRTLNKYQDINDIINKNLLPYNAFVDYESGNGAFNVRSNASESDILAYYDTVLKTIDEVKDAAKDLSKEQQDDIFGSKKYNDLIKTRDGLKDYVANYRDAYKLWVESKATEDIFAARADGLIDSKQAFNEYIDTLKETWKDDESLAAAIEVLNKMFPEYSGYVDDTTKALDENANAADRAANALERYKNAMSSGGEKDDNFQAMSDAFDKMVEAGDKGYFGSNAFQEGSKLLFGGWAEGKSGEEILKHAKELQSVFSDKSMGRGLLNLISDSDSAKVVGNVTSITDANNNLLASVRELDDGSLHFDITDEAEGLEELSTILGISKESIIAMQQAMGMFDETIDVSGLQEQFDGLFKEMEAGHTVEVDATAANEAVTSLSSAIASIPDTKNVTINVTVNGDTSLLGGGGKLRGAEFSAEGTSNFKGGLTWVNDEEGGFNPELIETGGKSFFVNGGKPALISLPKGAVIHNATDTRKLFANDITEVAYHKTGTVPKYDELKKRSGKVAGTGAGSGSAKSGDWWKQLQEYMDELLEKAGDALDKQLEAIDAELFYLQYGYEISEKATKLEEARMDLLEAEQELINAQTERTVRYFNAETGQWEWMADQRDIVKAQKELAEQQKNYLKAQYEYLEDIWKDLKDQIQDAIDGKSDIDIAKVLEQMLKSDAGGLTGDVEGVIGDLLTLITAYEEGTALDSYDSGGIASGLGFMRKATKADEVVLNGSLSSAILSPKRSQQFSDFTSSLERMFNMSSYMERPQSMMGFSTNDNHSTNVYMNGIKIGSDMLSRPLSEVLSVLPIYCN